MRKAEALPYRQPFTRWLPNIESRLLFLLLFLLQNGCSPILPDYAAPQIGKSSTRPLTYFSYRPLTIENFRATAPENGYQHKAILFQARSSLQIVPGKETSFRLTSGSLGGQVVYSGTVDELTFEAVFIPEQSWWDPNIPQNRTDYVLQHEQIHFALMELYARKLTREFKDNREGLPVIADTPEEVKSLLRQWLHNLIQKQQPEILQEHTTFDEFTSLGYAPAVQQRYWLDVQKKLSRQ